MVLAALLTGSAAIPVSAAALPYTQEFASGLGDIKALNAETGSPTFSYTSWNGYNYGGGVAYAGSATYAIDDCLATPALALEAGKVYTVSIMYKNGAYGMTHNLEIVGGKTLEAMTDKLVAASPIAYGYSFSTFTGRFEAKETGDYYIGVRLTGVAGTGSVYMDNFTVSVGVSAKAPSEVTALTATPAVENGKFIVNLGCKMPTLNCGGSAITETMSIKAVRADGVVVYETTDLAAGADVTFKDIAPLSTATSYTVTVANASGISPETKVNVNPVFSAPKAVTGLAVAKSGADVTLTWNPVTEAADLNGIFIPAEVVYTVQRNVGSNKTVVKENLKETTFIDNVPVPAAGQSAVSYTVTASYNKRSSAAAVSDIVMVGNPYSGEYAESFANYSYQTNTWTVQNNEQNIWIPKSSSWAPSCDPQDKDMGFLTCQNTKSTSVWIASPVINVSGMKNPRLDFYVFQDNSLTYTNSIQTKFRVGGKDIAVGTPIAVNGGAKGWNKFSFYVPAEAKNADFSVVFEGLPGDYACVCIDNITIKDILDFNLSMELFETGGKAKLGDKAILSATVMNKGSKTAAQYAVEFFLDAQSLGQVNAENLLSETSTVVSMPFEVIPNMAGKVLNFSAEIVYAGDEVTSDNRLDATLEVGTNDYPVPTNLGAAIGSTGNSVELAWTRPAVSTELVQTPVNEDFETWTSGSITPEKGWIYVDADNVPAFGINGVNSSAPMVALVAENVSYYTAHSGTKMLAVSRPNLYADKPDEWIISPEVIGGQTIKFFAASYSRWGSPYYEDEFTVCYSTGGTAPADFVAIGAVNKIKNTNWTEYTVTLPVDATRFALHVTNIGNDGILFDDISFVQGTKPLELRGYNVYRDGKKLATVDALTTNFSDVTVVLETNYQYTVSAVYDRGESLESAPVALKYSSVEEVALNDAAVRACEGGIKVLSKSGAKVEVFDAMARLVGSFVSSGDLFIPVNAGIYLVRLDGKTTKVVVR